MPRAARIVIAETPHHVTQRGNRCHPTFLYESDYAFYLGLLRRWSRKTGTAVWAWCLMPNHVHLILVPAKEDGLRATLAPVHKRYTWEVNQREAGAAICGRVGSPRFRWTSRTSSRACATSS